MAFGIVMKISDEPARAILQRIADGLDVPVERFFDDSLPSDGSELLRLWSRIKTQEGRRLALDALRVIADAEPARRA